MWRRMTHSIKYVDWSVLNKTKEHVLHRVLGQQLVTGASRMCSHITIDVIGTHWECTISLYSWSNEWVLKVWSFCSYLFNVCRAIVHICALYTKKMLHCMLNMSIMSMLITLFPNTIWKEYLKPRSEIQGDSKKKNLDTQVDFHYFRENSCRFFICQSISLPLYQILSTP